MCEHRLPHEPSDQRVTWFSGSWPPTVDSSVNACARWMYTAGPGSWIPGPNPGAVAVLAGPEPLSAQPCPPGPLPPAARPLAFTPYSPVPGHVCSSWVGTHLCPVQTQRLSSCGRAGGRTPVPELLPTAPHSTEEPVRKHYPHWSRTGVDTATAPPLQDEWTRPLPLPQDEWTRPLPLPSRMSGHARCPSPRMSGHAHCPSPPG